MARPTGKHQVPKDPIPQKVDPVTQDLGPLQDEWPESSTVVRVDGVAGEPPALADWALVVYAGHSLGQLFPLPAGECLLGRAAQAGLSLPDDEVSRLHARIRLEPGPGGPRLTLEDLGSTNGTTLNGDRIPGPVVLKAGDRIGLGHHILKLIALDPLERDFHQTLLDQSTRDSLTGLANRAATLAELQVRFDLARRYGRPLCAVMVDLDHFKRINDALGHGAGDEVLKGVGERLRANLRTSDFAGRIGGEEFLAILSETDLGGGSMFAERVRAAGEAAYDTPMGLLTSTCSVGVAQLRADDAGPGALLARADAALYEAKAGGRNRVAKAT